MLLLIAMLLVMTVGLAVVGHLSSSAGQRKDPYEWTLRDLAVRAYRGNNMLAAGPRYQYEQIAHKTR